MINSEIISYVYLKEILPFCITGIRHIRIGT
jgi:hypothetical protein